MNPRDSSKTIVEDTVSLNLEMNGTVHTLDDYIVLYLGAELATIDSINHEPHD